MRLAFLILLTTLFPMFFVDALILNVENLAGYIRISEGRDAGSFHHIGGAVRCEGKKEDIVIVLPRRGTSGFFRAIRSL